jgi:hypothetical protein
LDSKEKYSDKEIEDKIFVGTSTSRVSENLFIGKSTAKRELLVLEALGLIICRREPTTNPDKFYEYWHIKPSKDIIQGLLHSSHCYYIYPKIQKNIVEDNNSSPYPISLDDFKGPEKEIEQRKNQKDPDQEFV